MVMTASTAPKVCARDRLLAAANELFYREGVQSVGIDRIIEQAGVAKASLYNTFGSKDELIRAYLESRHASVADRMARSLKRYDTPRERLLGVFETQGRTFGDPNYRGCAFVMATAEAQPGSSTVAAADNFRTWVRALFTELAEQAGVADPSALARQLHLLYDGAMLAARMDRDASASAAAKGAASALLDAALAAPVRPARPAKAAPRAKSGRARATA
jgi:AcrR family transcriptional regulator